MGHLVVRLAAVLTVALLPAAPATSEIYKWTDESGQVHFTQDLDQVPARHRALSEARAKSPSGRDRIQTYRPVLRSQRTSPAARGRPSHRQSSSFTKARSSKKEHHIRVQRAGSSMRVLVRLNNDVTAPFIIDTGASLVTLPRHVADDLGLELSGARTARFTTANGVVESPLVMLDTVQLGSARAENVQASVFDGMRVGLLGLSFFNRFTYNVDAQKGVVTLVENDMTETGAIRGGRSEAQWRNEFYGITGRLAEIERRREVVPRSHSRRHGELDRMQEEIERQHVLLESEADNAHVPFSWRD